ncbi:MFS transporter [Acetobacter nitrogenifigens]|uniref:MFS transporter n=1 Tax=Acetobacter nitrogenifigens DSM 23921 = NBRC 105050 TaxID=1120919 RepID=A0A511X7T5_9PROT|nr:MFS transporter [Acetobacter nitrogenifigens]GEN58991.1 MFS transporter [Acetobacter nitrogenifigens DSM 23921 = NBRC 105050]
MSSSVRSSLAQYAEDTSTIPKKWSPYRYAIYFAMFFMGVVSYSDRAVLSAAMPDIVREFKIGPVTAGWLMSSFLWSYFLLHIPSAFLVSRWGSRRIGAWAVALWSLALMTISYAATLPQLFLTRILLGACESPCFTLGLKSIRNWAPPSEHGLAMTIGKAGVPMGLALGALLGGELVSSRGWRIAFLVIGACGLAWSIIWRIIFRDAPGRESASSEKELAADWPLIGRALRSPTFWMMIAQQCAGAYATFLFLSWMPLFYVYHFNLSTEVASLYFGLSYIVATPLSALASAAFKAWGADRATHSGGRRVFILILSLLSTSIVLIPYCTNAIIAALVAGVGMALIIASLGENTALFTDFDQRGDSVTQLYAIALTCSGATGIAAPAITGYLVANGQNFQMAFILAAFFLVLGALALFCAPAPGHDT